MRILLWATLVFAGASWMHAQGSSSTARHTVVGTVVNSVTREPIRRALVRIGGPEQRGAFTGQDGRFELKDVTDGQYSFTAQKPGFFDLSTMTGEFRPSHLQAVGPATGELVLNLIPEATVEGRVVDNNGEPIEAIPVQLLAKEIVEGYSRRQMHGTSSTDDEGFYHISGLQPGTYLVHTGSRTVFAGSANVISEGQDAQIYPPQFYPDSPDSSSAQAIELQPGTTAHADFTMSLSRAVSVRGVISGFQNGVFLSYEDLEGNQVNMQERFDPRTGKFVAQVAPGSWRLRFQTNDGQGRTLYAEEIVNADASDIEGLQIHLQPLISVPVHLVHGTQAVPNVQLRLISKTQPANVGFTSSQSGDPAILRFSDVLPGVYRLTGQSFGDLCIDTLEAASSDLMREDYTVLAGSQPPTIEVNLSDQCATLSGSVSGDASGFAILVSQSVSMAPVVTPIPPRGKFQFPNIRPGSYVLYAFSDLAGLEYAKPDALREFPGQQVSLAPGQKNEIAVELVSRGNP
ncbi:MAG: carboxypeptidase regulatory-like domain-containing protein [Acidobacteriaceae bacterium]|nr:carboxypeptidase regulatory-like domain-containing protein [Acidobacteriaceae bacterium]